MIEQVWIALALAVAFLACTLVVCASLIALSPELPEVELFTTEDPKLWRPGDLYNAYVVTRVVRGADKTLHDGWAIPQWTVWGVKS
jgi:hypothetical protein